MATGLMSLILLVAGFNLLIITLASANEIAKVTVFQIPFIRRWLYEEEPVRSHRTR